MLVIYIFLFKKIVQEGGNAGNLHFPVFNQFSCNSFLISKT